MAALAQNQRQRSVFQTNRIKGILVMANEKKKRPPVLLIHKKSCNRPDVKEAVRAFQQQGGKIKVIIPWSRKDMKRAVRREIRKGTRRVIAGGGDGTLNDVISILMKHHRNDDVRQPFGIFVGEIIFSIQLFGAFDQYR